MDSLNYWKRREEIAKQNYITEEEEYNRNLAQLYNSMLVNIETQINSFYQKYATAEKITMAEAMQKVAQMDVQAFQAKAKQYVQTRDFSKRANQELRLYNATMKINRLELLKANIGLEMIDTFNQMQGQFDTNLLKRAADEFERQAGILGMGVDDAPRLARTIVNASFHNADFSTRIWLYQGQLKNELSSLLSNGIVQGIHSRELAKQLEKKFGASKYNAERLMRTEMARVQIAAQEESYKANGYEQYVFLAIGTACPDCLALNEQHFNVSDMQAGKNAPPIHPNCRCSTAAWMDRAETMKQIKAMSQVVSSDEDESDIGDKISEFLTGVSKQKKEFEKGLENISNVNAKKLLKQSLDRTQIKRNQGKRSKYSASDKTIYIAKNSTADTIAHELFHEIDDTYGLTKNGMLSKSIGSDYSRLQSLAKGNGKSIEEVLYSKYPKAFEQNENRIKFKEQYRGISDILNGMSGGTVRLGFRHPDEYWKDKINVAKETWAQYGRMLYTDNAALGLAKELFPDISSEIVARIERMIK